MVEGGGGGGGGVIYIEVICIECQWGLCTRGDYVRGGGKLTAGQLFELSVRVFLPVSRQYKSFIQPLSLLTPPNTYSLLPTAAIVADDLGEGIWPPGTGLVQEWHPVQDSEQQPQVI